MSRGSSSEEETRTIQAHTEEQIVAVLRQVEAGARADDVCERSNIASTDEGRNVF